MLHTIPQKFTGNAMSMITTEVDRVLAAVKITFEVNGNSHFGGLPPNTTGAIKITSGGNDYVGGGFGM